MFVSYNSVLRQENTTSFFNFSWSKITEKKTGKSKANYSANACIKHCYLENVRKECSCYDPTVITRGYAQAVADVLGFDVPKACNITEVNHCMNRVSFQIRTKPCIYDIKKYSREFYEKT